MTKHLEDGEPSLLFTTRNTMLRLLYLVGQLHTGGLERQLYYVLRTMDRERYKPAVAVWNYREDDVHIAPLRALDIPLYALPNNVSPMVKLRAFRDLVRRLKPEVVHSYTFYTNFAAYWAVRGTSAVALGSIRSDFAWAKTECGPWLGRLSARWPSHQICNSYSAAETVRRSRSIFAPKQLYVVRNGLDLDRFQNIPLPTNTPVCILGVGYLLPVKRWDWLLEAVSELKHRDIECSIRIAGDGPLLPTLEQRAQDFGIAGRIEFLGHVDDIPKLLAEATFLVHTAANEGCPNAVIEAMACGRAVVAMDAGDVISLVEDGETGFVVPSGDIMTLVDRMLSLIANRKLCQRMGEAGRAKSEREFGLDRLVTETIAAYRQAGWKDESLYRSRSGQGCIT